MPHTRELEPAEATAVLRRHLAAAATCESVERGPVGNGQETWFLTVEVDGEQREFVLRRTAAAGPLEETDRTVEAEVMNAVAARGLPVPSIHVVQPDASELGAPYLIMDRATGSPAIQAQGEERRAASVDLVRQFAHLHERDRPGRDDETDAVAATRAEIERWRRYYFEHRIGAVPLIGALFAWLETNMPQHTAGPAALLWGDAGSHNALQEGGRITALLDWELAHRGHPIEDLASAIWVDQYTGGPPPQLLIDAYEQARGITVDREVLDYFIILICVIRTVMIQVGAAAFIEGRTNAPSLAGLGLDQPVTNLARAAALAGWGEVDLPDLPTPPTPDDGILRPSGPEIDQGLSRFLADDVLPRVSEPWTRRGLKTAVALLAAAGRRNALEDQFRTERHARRSCLLEEFARAGVEGNDFEEAAMLVEGNDRHAGLRGRLRDHLLTDLAWQRALLMPLHDLYHR